VQLVDDVRRRLDEQVIPQLPAGLTLKVSSDDSAPIRKIVAALQDHLVEGTVLAGLVVWFFLRSFRSTVIIATAIPVSLLGAIAAMYFLGYTFNQMSLLGLLLLIGVVVDDAIVVLENVYRRLEENPALDRRTAAIEGTEQVGFRGDRGQPHPGVDLRLGAVPRGHRGALLPVVRRGGDGRRAGLAVRVAHAHADALLALPRSFREARPDLPVLRPAARRARRFLSPGARWTLARRGKVLVATLAIVLSSGYFFAQVGKDFIPEEDDGRFTVSFRAPLGTSRQAMDAVLDEIDQTIRRHPEVRASFIGVGFGAPLRSTAGGVRDHGAARGARHHAGRVPAPTAGRTGADPGRAGVRVRAFAIGGMRGEQLQFTIVGPDLDSVAALSNELARRLGQEPNSGVSTWTCNSTFRRSASRWTACALPTSA